MKWCGVVVLVFLLCEPTYGGFFSKKSGSKSSGKKKNPSKYSYVTIVTSKPSYNKKATSRPNYPRQPASYPNYPRQPDSRPPYNPNYNQPGVPSSDWNTQSGKPPDAGWNVKPPDAGWKPNNNPNHIQPNSPPNPGTYNTKNPSYPVSGGNHIPSQYPTSGHHPQPGHYPHYPNLGYPQGSYPQQFPEYPQSYGGYHNNKPKVGFSVPGIVPLPIPIPIGGGGFHYGSHGGGFFKTAKKYVKRKYKDSKRKKYRDDYYDYDDRPRIELPPDLELDGVMELPAESPIAQWDVIGKETAMDLLEHR